MPTVRADIEPVAVLPATKGKKPQPRASIFPAEHWEKWGGQPGRWRVMLGQAWHNRAGERASFFTTDGIRAMFGESCLRTMGLQPDASAVVGQSTPRGTLVWLVDAMPAGEEGEAVERAHFATRTRAEPFLDEYGEWRVWIAYRNAPVLLADLRPRADGRGFDLRDAQAVAAEDKLLAEEEAS